MAIPPTANPASSDREADTSCSPSAVRGAADRTRERLGDRGGRQARAAAVAEPDDVAVEDDDAQPADLPEPHPVEAKPKRTREPASRKAATTTRRMTSRKKKEA